jgi:hypothetical protein
MGIEHAHLEPSSPHIPPQQTTGKTEKQTPWMVSDLMGDFFGFRFFQVLAEDLLVIDVHAGEMEGRSESTLKVIGIAFRES